MAAKVVLVTGASSGFGQLAVHKLVARGYVVYAAARRIERMADLEAEGAHLLRMDVTSDDDVARGVKEIITTHGSIYGLVNNAGYGAFGAVENMTLAAARQQFDVNVFGMVRVTKAVLPYMRRSGGGRIVNVSSLVGKVSFAMAGWYSASKHAVEALSDALRNEVKVAGIQVSIIEPGPVQTEFLDRAFEQLAQVDHDPYYQPRVEHLKQAFTRSYAHADGPEKTAQAIVAAIDSACPRIRYRVNGSRPVLIARAVLPTRVFDYFVNKSLGE